MHEARFLGRGQTDEEGDEAQELVRKQSEKNRTTRAIADRFERRSGGPDVIHAHRQQSTQQPARHPSENGRQQIEASAIR